jgi:hypothetical protein
MLSWIVFVVVASEALCLFCVLLHASPGKTESDDDEERRPQ